MKPKPTIRPVLNLGLDTEDADGRPTIYALKGRSISRVFEAGPAAQDELLGILTDLSKQYRVHVWTLNIGYDLVNLFGDMLPDTCQLFMAGRKVCGAHFKGIKDSKAYDLGRFIPRWSAVDWGKAVRCPKLEVIYKTTLAGERYAILGGFDDPSRCLRDATIAWRGGEAVAAVMDSLGFQLKFSGISSALSSLETEGKLPVAEPEVKDWSNKALYGGRVEVVFHGDVRPAKGEQLFYMDFKACYAWAMMEPLPDYTQWFESDEPEAPQYIADVDVEVVPMGDLGALPYHDEKKGLIYPVGTWRGTYTSEDLGAAGVRVVKYHKVINFPTSGRYLAALMRTLIPKSEEGKIRRAMKKFMYTGLSGKFAQRPDFSLFMHYKNAKPEDWWNGISLGDYLLAKRKGKAPRTANVIWTAFILSRGRRKLWDLYRAIYARGGRLLFGNTDSALTKLPGLAAAKAILTMFDEKLSLDKVSEAHVFGPGAYVWKDHQGTVHMAAKGVPGRLHQELLDDGEAEGEVPMTFFQLMRGQAMAGQLQNTWNKKTFAWAGRKLSRRPGSDGWTAPVHMKNGKPYEA